MDLPIYQPKVKFRLFWLAAVASFEQKVTRPKLIIYVFSSVFPSWNWRVSSEHAGRQYICQPMFSSGRRRVYVRRGRQSSGAPGVHFLEQLACACVSLSLSLLHISSDKTCLCPPDLGRHQNVVKKASPAEATEFGRARDK
jgi:hypothetical protein